MKTRAKLEKTVAVAQDRVENAQRQANSAEQAHSQAVDEYERRKAAPEVLAADIAQRDLLADVPCS